MIELKDSYRVYQYKEPANLVECFGCGNWIAEREWKRAGIWCDDCGSDHLAIECPVCGYITEGDVRIADPNETLPLSYKEALRRFNLSFNDWRELHSLANAGREVSSAWQEADYDRWEALGLVTMRQTTEDQLYQPKGTKLYKITPLGMSLFK